MLPPNHQLYSMTRNHPDSKVHGANMEPTWVLSAPDGPHVDPINLAIWASTSAYPATTWAIVYTHFTVVLFCGYIRRCIVFLIPFPVSTRLPKAAVNQTCRIWINGSQESSKNWQCTQSSIQSRSGIMSIMICLSWYNIIAQVYRLSAVHCQMTRYSQRVPGYLTRYSVSANEISFDSQWDCVFQIRLGLQENDSPLHLVTSSGFLKA